MYESGSVFSPDVLDIADEDLLKKFMEVRRVSIHFVILSLLVYLSVWLANDYYYCMYYLTCHMIVM